MILKKKISWFKETSWIKPTNFSTLQVLYMWKNGWELNMLLCLDLVIRLCK